MLVQAAVSVVIARTYNFCVELGKARLPGIVEDEHGVDHFLSASKGCTEKKKKR